MKFRLEIECDNAAFEEPDRDTEIVRILQDAVTVLNLGFREGVKQSLRDANGNIVGFLELVEED